MAELEPRLLPVDNPDPETAEILARTLVSGGRPANVFATLAHHPRLLKRFNVLGGFFLTRGRLPARDREVVILRTAHLAGSEYEFGQHTVIGRAAGLSEHEITALAAERCALAGRDAALVAVAEEIHAGAVLADATWAALREGYDEQQAIEAIMLAGFYRMLAGFLNTVRVEQDPGVPGWPPERPG